MVRKTHVFLILIAVLALGAFPNPVMGQSAKGLRTVVIDPGHGGDDTGALGLKKASSGYHEKDIVLSISLLLGEKIEKAYPDVKVMYTRDKDVFISRNDRAKMANQYADLFISIHCNGSEDLSASGTSVHILGSKSKNSKNTTDYFEQNQSVAARRNDLIVVEGDDVTTRKIDADQTSGHISSTLLWKAIYESSLLFASEVIDNLIK
jgi:N-acetylmuramoyl-L-alanine amidase